MSSYYDSFGMTPHRARMISYPERTTNHCFAPLRLQQQRRRRYRWPMKVMRWHVPLLTRLGMPRRRHPS